MLRASPTCDAAGMTARPPLEELLRAIASTADGDIRSLAVVDLRIGEGEATPIHAHEHDEAFHVLEGELVVHLAQRSVRLGAGDGFTAPAREPHAVVGGRGGARYLATAFTPSVSRYADFQRAVAVPAVRPEPSEAVDVVRALGAAAGITVHGFAAALPGSA